MSVTVAEILDAARAAHAVLSAETVGYLVLGAADRVAHASPATFEIRDIELDDRGGVTVPGVRPAAHDQAPALLQTALNELLACVSAGGSAAVARVGRSTEPVDVPRLVQGLEVALIPLNRAAGRRALARLHRDVARARSVGALRRIATPVLVAPVEEPTPSIAADESPPGTPLVDLPAVQEKPAAKAESGNEAPLAAVEPFTMTWQEAAGDDVGPAPGSEATPFLGAWPVIARDVPEHDTDRAPPIVAEDPVPLADRSDVADPTRALFVAVAPERTQPIPSVPAPEERSAGSSDALAVIGPMWTPVVDAPVVAASELQVPVTRLEDEPDLHEPPREAPPVVESFEANSGRDNRSVPPPIVDAAAPDSAPLCLVPATADAVPDSGEHESTSSARSVDDVSSSGAPEKEPSAILLPDPATDTSAEPPMAVAELAADVSAVPAIAAPENPVVMDAAPPSERDIDIDVTYEDDPSLVEAAEAAHADGESPSEATADASPIDEAAFDPSRGEAEETSERSDCEGGAPSDAVLEWVVREDDGIDAEPDLPVVRAAWDEAPAEEVGAKDEDLGEIEWLAPAEELPATPCEVPIPRYDPREEYPYRAWLAPSWVSSPSLDVDAIDAGWSVDEESAPSVVALVPDRLVSIEADPIVNEADAVIADSEPCPPDIECPSALLGAASLLPDAEGIPPGSTAGDFPSEVAESSCSPATAAVDGTAESVSPSVTETPPPYRPRQSDVSDLLAGFTVAESRSLREMSEDLKRIAGVAVTPPPPGLSPARSGGNGS